MHLIILLIVSVIFFVYSCYKLTNDSWAVGWYIGMMISGISTIYSLVFSLAFAANTSTEPTTYTVETTARYVFVYTPKYEFKFDKKIDFDLWTAGKPAAITHYYNAWGVELTGSSGKQFPTINIIEQ